MAQVPNRLYSQTAAGTAVTNTTTETAVASYTIEGGTLAAGKSIKFSAVCRATATNDTDTLLYKVYIGSTAIATLTAVDQANNDIALFDGELTSYALAASTTVVSKVIANDSDATGQAARCFAAVTSSVDTTADIVLSIKATWSAASASDSCYCAMFNVDEV